MAAFLTWLLKVFPVLEKVRPYVADWWKLVGGVVAALALWAYHGHAVSDAYKQGVKDGTVAEQQLTQAKIAGALAAKAQQDAEERERQNQITKENADAHRKEMEQATADNDALRKRLGRVRLCPSVPEAGVPADQAGANAAAADDLRPPGAESWSHEAGLGFLAPIILSCEQDAIDYDGLVDWYRKQRAESLHAAGISPQP